MKPVNDNTVSLRQCIDVMHGQNMNFLHRLEQLPNADLQKLSEARYHFIVAYEMMLQAVSNVAIQQD